MQNNYFNTSFVSFQYNEELHYVEPCLNGTLVQADITNKDVSFVLFPIVFSCYSQQGIISHFCEGDFGLGLA